MFINRSIKHLEMPYVCIMKYKDTNYDVAENGVVTNKHGKQMKQWNNKMFKYMAVTLSQNNKPFVKYVHRLVAEIYIPNPDNKAQVNHKDGNKLNNHVSNLEWVTVSENIQHMYDTGLKTYKPLHYKGKFGSEHNRSKGVICIETGIKYGSQSEAQRLLKLGGGSVSWSIKHKKPIFGMHFELRK